MPRHQLGRFHFFNTFFFKKLTEKPSEAARERELGRLAASLGMAEGEDPLWDCTTQEERHARMNYQRVRKWTKVGLLTWDSRGSRATCQVYTESEGPLARGALRLDSCWRVGSRARACIRVLEAPGPTLVALQGRHCPLCMMKHRAALGCQGLKCSMTCLFNHLHVPVAAQSMCELT